ncbi:pantetheine-phosphate adenylyltransferase [Helicobacter muridarum]|uniref:Phosphopantetheine adenylyltransferase n=1 Tax=Helicobacter muridarum TaxID=216 RepID=A0A099TZA6_9HELI|nr:pantetheine-phosphate adenylyltransferase [Helicobacter muridarum]TLE01690.1 pantetheine-phosphate adenylyltransferase [Helicobacter muridarum]STQ86330.1 phosphopantetheine adenylyltransferase [Helicobacter muridarum]
MKKLAIYPGTFDPLTNGHVDIIRRSIAMFKHVIVAVAKSESKNPLYTLYEREKMVQLALKEYDFDNVSCLCFDNLLADFASELGATVIIRGLRVVSDFEYELQMGYANASLNDSLDTIYFMPTLQNAFISSSIVRSIITHNGRFNHLVPQSIHDYIKSK